MIRIEGLVSGYGRIQVLNGIDLHVRRGTFTGILGHNGMGKSTLLKAIVGHLPASAGKIELAGEDVTRLPVHLRARKGIGYVPQGRQIFPTLSVLDNLRMGCAAKGLPDDGIDAILEDFPQLKRLLDRPGGALSGGEQQLLALARCLCGNPSVILLDEPTEGIQPSILQEIVERLHAIRRKRELTLLLVEQNLEFIRGLSERIFTIQKGRIARELDPARLDDHDLTAEFAGV
ncbi:ABC transporter ATP-binding protein [Geminicoccus flavidas]|uniref:ABC transporter ATP-binding protein n=1 Tax=Geminicoccus flavidas TaxID=2506407 RepID=UPI00135914C1|nr:ABC transporter ATP-binding protein [Geminicoccus flavidas]